MSIISPSDPPRQLQTAQGAPDPSGFNTITSPLLIPQRTDFRMRHFPSSVYNLTDTSHLVRIMRVLIGDAGAGQLRKRLLMARMGEKLQGSYFFDLDRFYGALFGIQRSPSELLTLNPYSDVADQATWRAQHAADQSYRDRLFQFGRAISYGPSPTGMQLIAEAMLNVPCDIYESFLYADVVATTFLQRESMTYGQLEAFTYAQLEGTSGTVPHTVQRYQFTITPHRPISLSEAYDLNRVISRIKPANTLAVISPGGIVLHTAVPLRGAWATSRYWEITATVTPSTTGPTNPYPITLPSFQRRRHPFSSYQGETWTYNGDFTGMLAYAEDWPGHVVMPVNNERIKWNDGTYTDFLPPYAVLTGWQTLLARYAKDGVVSINPLAGRPAPGTNHAVSLAPVTIDGINLDDLNIALEKTNGTSVARTSNDPHRYWSTPPRDQSDLTREVFEVRMGTAHTVNTINFEVAHFPQHVSVQYYNTTAGQWYELFNRDITESIPAILPRHDQYLDNHTHPQHVGETHWLNLSCRFNPVSFQRLRVVLNRVAGTAPGYWVSSDPTDAGKPDSDNIVKVPYSLGIRHFRVGYIVDGPEALPVSNLPGNLGVLGISPDILGSPVTYSVYEEQPSGPISFAPTQWRCEPQPVSNAVVCYYVDARDINGLPQVFDRFYVDPINLGVHCTLYYSNDSPPISGAYAAADDPLPPGVANYSGNIAQTPMGLQFSGSSPSYIDVVNGALQWNPQKDWWAGLTFRSPKGSNGVLPLLDLGGTQVSIQNGTVLFNPANGDIDLSISHTITPNAVVDVVVGYLANGNTDFPGVGANGVWVLQIQVGSELPITVTGPAGNAIVANPPTLRLNGFLTSNTSATSGIALMNLVLKSETLLATTAAGYVNNALPYATKGIYRGQDARLTDNAHLRFDPSFFSNTNPGGLVGGPPTFYDDLSWTPVPRDYILTKGYLFFNPTSAKFWKFEMTNLVAVPYEGFLPVTKKVRFFPASIIDVDDKDEGYGGDSPPGAATLAAFSSGQNFNYSGIHNNSTIQPDSRDYKPTEALVHPDPTTAAALAQQSPHYNYGDWHQGFKAPRFAKPSVHRYQIADIAHTSKVGFFCGFKQLVGYRLIFQADNDALLYDEHFDDGVNIAANTWIQNPEDLTTANQALPVVARSVSLLSQHNVTSIQYATHQTAALQLVTDDDIRDPQYISSSFTNVDFWHKTGDAIPVYDQLSNSVRVSRTAQGSPPIYQASPRSLVEPPVSPVFDILALGAGGAPGSTSTFGGLISGICLGLSSAGRVWVATRFTPLTPLTQPLYLQLINANNDAVITQWQVTGVVGQPTEVYFPYDIGSIVASGTPVRVGLVQYGKSNDSWSIDTISLFDEGIVWEFSVDGGITWFNGLGVRNNANGVLTFAVPGNELVWRVTGYHANMHVTSLRIRPIYQGMMSTSRPNGMMRGPNLSVFDHEPDIWQDPLFTGWTKPIPQWWFNAFKNYPALFPDGVPIITQYSRFYARPTSDDLSLTPPVDVATRRFTSVRRGDDRLDVFNPLTDVATRSGVFGRVQIEDLSSTFADSCAVFVTKMRRTSSVVAPTVHPPEWTDDIGAAPPPSISLPVVILPPPLGPGLDDTAALNAIMVTPATIYQTNGGRYQVRGQLQIPVSAVLQAPFGSRCEFNCDLASPTTDMIRLAGTVSTLALPLTIRRIDFTGSNTAPIAHYVPALANFCFISVRKSVVGNIPSQYIRVEDCTCSGTYGDFFTIQDFSGHAVVTNCTIKDAGRQGVSVANGHDILFDTLKFGDPTRTGSQIAFNCVDLEMDTTTFEIGSVTVQNCVRYCAVNAGAFVAISGGNIHDIVIQNNIGSHDSAGKGYNCDVSSTGHDIQRSNIAILNNSNADVPHGAAGSELSYHSVKNFSGVTVSGNKGFGAPPHPYYGSIYTDCTGINDTQIAADFPTCDAVYKIHNTPSPPTAVTAVVVDPRTVAVSWTLPLSAGSDGPIVSYEADSSGAPVGGGSAVVVGATATTVNVLVSANNTWTFTVFCKDSAGNNSASSAPSNSVSTPPGPPAEAKTPSAVAGAGSATVSWTAPNTGGSALTGYTITPYLGTVAQTPTTFAAPATSHLVTGLTPGLSYKFTIFATNVLGDAWESAKSNSVIPT